MGNHLVRYRLHACSCISGAAAAEEQKILWVVKEDGKVLEFSSPVLVKDILVNFAGVGIGYSKGDREHLPEDYELKMGQVYYLLPSLGSESHGGNDLIREENGGVKRIKVVMTKRQLQKLVEEKMSMTEILLPGLEKKTWEFDDSPRNWKPKLHSIPEENEQCF